MSEKDAFEAMLLRIERLDSSLRYGWYNPDDGTFERMTFANYLRRTRVNGGGEQGLERRVGRTTWKDYMVSTVFLTIAHGMDENQWFETMVFKRAADDETWDSVDSVTERYATYAEAVVGHNAVVCRVLGWEAGA